MNSRRFLTTAPLALILIAPGRLAAQEKPEHPKSKERYTWFEENGTWKKKPAA
jgi:hypothetical protein